MSEDTAPVNVGNKNHGALGHLSHAHVHYVVFLKVDFGRTSRPFKNDNVMVRGKLIVGFHNVGHEGLFKSEIFLCGHVAQNLAVHDYLTSCVAVRFKENRIHKNAGLHSRRLGLHDLSTAHLKPLARDK